MSQVEPHTHHRSGNRERLVLTARRAHQRRQLRAVGRWEIRRFRRLRLLSLFLLLLRLFAVFVAPALIPDHAGAGELQLGNYDVIILPPGSSSGYARAFGESGAEKLRDWVTSGGVLIGIAGGAEYLADPELEFTSARVIGDERGRDEDGEEPEEEEEQAQETEAPRPEDLPPAHGAQLPPLVSPTGGEDKPLSVPGAMMRVRLDLTHPLTLGYNNEAIAVLLSGDDFYRPSEEGSSPAAFVGGNHLISGYEWPDNTEKFLEDTAWMIDEPVDDGRVILFADDPNFRLIWPSLSRLFLNAILIGPSVR